jgi:CRISPR-associated protein Cas1
MEGIRMRQAYADAAKEFHIEWKGRSYNREKWDYSDPINRALSAANSCLYGLTHDAILSAGYSPALGFIHTGKQLSFVYDIADLYKAELTIPLAFRITSQNSPDLEREVRIACRDKFRESRLIERIIPDIARVLDVDPDAVLKQQDEFADDAALPAELWEPKTISASLSVGKILKLKADTDYIAKEVKHDDSDSGTGPGLTAG